MVLKLTRWLGVLAVATLFAAPAQAQDAGEITRRSVAAMHRVTEVTVHDIRAAAIAGVETIEKLDAHGASDEELIAAARRALRHIAIKARRGSHHIDLIASRTIVILHDMKADRRFFRIIHEARARSLETIGAARHRGSHAVRVALEKALGG